MSLCGSGAGLYFMEKPSLWRAGMSPSKEPLTALRLMLESLMYQVGIPQTYIEPSESMAWKDLYQLEDRSEAGRTIRGSHAPRDQAHDPRSGDLYLDWVRNALSSIFRKVLHPKSIIRALAAKEIVSRLCGPCMIMDGDEPPDEDPRITQTPVQGLPSRLPSRFLTGEVEILLALPPPECFVCTKCSKKLVCRSQA